MSASQVTKATSVLGCALIFGGCMGMPQEHRAGDSQEVSAGGSKASVTLLKIQDPLRGKQADPGWRNLGVFITIKNTGDNPLSLSPSAASRLMASWEALPVGTVDGGPCDTNFSFDTILVPKGGEASGCVVFQAKKQIKPSRYSFALGEAGSQKTISWKLN